ncbi:MULTISPECIES: DUF4328 domain-containing protein [unclassified Sphingomonas]|jgi:Domain of unknown function (DUF4328)|nr:MULTISPECIES: DUF4328 domain-containing protein [unclassified Sphingomonas]
MKTRGLWPLTLATIAMVMIDAATNPMLLIAYHLWPDLYELHALAELASVEVKMDMLIWTLLTMCVFAWWIFRAGKNLVALGYVSLAFTPAVRIWWFLVPLANLVIPYHGMRELWNASHGKADLGETPPLVAIWWGLWLFSFFDLIILGVFAGPFELMTIIWIQSVTGIALASAVIPMLWGIARAQAAQRGPALTDIFS